MHQGSAVFNYRAHRAFVGFIAFLLPILVSVVMGTLPPSISHSYYHPHAGDLFVGSLGIVFAFLLTYNGHDWTQSVVSKIGGVAALLVALVPTAPRPGMSSVSSTIHFAAAVVFLGTLMVFCLWFFPRRIRLRCQAQGHRAPTPRERRRMWVYYSCGGVMAGALVVAAGAMALLPPAQLYESRWLFWAETVALAGFGVGWFVSGKTFRLYADEQDLMPLRSIVWPGRNETSGPSGSAGP